CTRRARVRDPEYRLAAPPVSDRGPGVRPLPPPRTRKPVAKASVDAAYQASSRPRARNGSGLFLGEARGAPPSLRVSASAEENQAALITLLLEFSPSTTGRAYHLEGIASRTTAGGSYISNTSARARGDSPDETRVVHVFGGLGLAAVLMRDVQCFSNARDR